MIQFSEAAQGYLTELLAEQDVDGMGIRVFVNDPGTTQAEVGFSFCVPGEHDDDDIIIAYDTFKVFVEKDSAPFLEDSSVDRVDNQLTIKAPNIKVVPNISDDSPLDDRVNHVLDSEVNPALAGHGGWVKLVEITADNTAILEFGGGCVGCSMSFMTMKQGVERSLMDKIPELKGTRDVTDHSDSTNAYYK